MSDIARRLRKAREFTVKIGKFTFTVRRPTDVEALVIDREGATFDQIAAKFVVGWDGVVEDDVVGGGGQTPLQFDRDDWEDWVVDRTDFWAPIASALLDRYLQHRSKAEAVVKN